MARILVVDDDPYILRLVERALALSGHMVETATSGEEGLSRALAAPTDMVILDGRLPDRDGLEVLAELRTRRRDLPVLMLTARDSADEQVQGLELGADDYVVKPFDVQVLLARVRALLRRLDTARLPELHFADLTLDAGLRCARRGSRLIELTATEYELLYQFMANPRQVLSKSLLLDRVWGYDFGGNDNVVEVYVRQLRQKLESGGESRLIHTLRGTGYVLREPSPSDHAVPGV